MNDTLDIDPRDRRQYRIESAGGRLYVYGGGAEERVSVQMFSGPLSLYLSLTRAEAVELGEALINAGVPF